jgi:hypothetical protein
MQIAGFGPLNLRPALAGQAVIVWRYAFDMGADVAAFAADSCSLLRVTGRRESAARYKSLPFEFSAATAQAPTLQVNKRGRRHTALSLVMAPTPAGRGAQVRQASDAAGALHRVHGKAIATSRRLISTLGAPLE